MSKEVLKCPFSLDQVQFADSGKREEKKEKFGEYPKEIQFLGLLLVEFGMCRYEDATSFIDEKKSDSISEWYERIFDFYFTNGVQMRQLMLSIMCGQFGAKLFDAIYGNYKFEFFYYEQVCQHERELLLKRIKFVLQLWKVSRKSLLNQAILSFSDKTTLGIAVEKVKIALEKILLAHFQDQKKVNNILGLVEPFIHSEILSGTDLMAQSSFGETVHPKNCTFKNGELQDASSPNNGYSSFARLNFVLDDKGRVFFNPSNCPFTMAIPDIQQK